MKTAKCAGAISGALFLALFLCGALSPAAVTARPDAREWFTIQAASFSEKRNALGAYEALQRRLGPEANVRVEHLPPYYTLRVGFSETREPILELLPQVKAVHPAAIILQAYIDPERIVSADDPAPEVLAATGDTMLDVKPAVGEAAGVTTPPSNLPETTPAVVSEALSSVASKSRSTEKAFPTVQDEAVDKVRAGAPAHRRQPAATPRENRVPAAALVGVFPAKEDRIVDIFAAPSIVSPRGRQFSGVGQRGRIRVTAVRQAPLPEAVAVEPVEQGVAIAAESAPVPEALPESSSDAALESGAGSAPGAQVLARSLEYLKSAGTEEVAGLAGLGAGIALLFLTPLWFVAKGRRSREQSRDKPAGPRAKKTSKKAPNESRRKKSGKARPITLEDLLCRPSADEAEQTAAGDAATAAGTETSAPTPEPATDTGQYDTFVFENEGTRAGEVRQGEGSVESMPEKISKEDDRSSEPIPLGPAPEHERHRAPYVRQTDMERRIARGEVAMPVLAATGEAFMKRASAEFEVMVRNILNRSADQDLTSIYVTSCSSGEGKTRVSMALAHCLAGEGYRVLLVDANSVAPVLHDMYNTSFSPGLLEALNGGACEVRDLVRPSRHENLHIMTLGSKPLSSHGNNGGDGGNGAGSQGFPLNILLGALAEDFEFVILDGQSLSEPFSMFVASTCDGTIVVAPWEKPKWHTIKKSAQEIVLFGGSVVGLVQNKRPVYLPGFIFRKSLQEQCVEVAVETSRMGGAMPSMGMSAPLSPPSPLSEVESEHKALHQ
jgi:Mrp family chromosome partitioning ATPase